MITLIHGSDPLLSRNFFFNEKKKYQTGEWEVRDYSLDSSDLSELAALSQAKPLFMNGVALFIESLKKPQDPENFSFLKNVPSENAIVFWIGETIPKNSVFLKYVVQAKGKIVSYEEKKSKLLYDFSDTVLKRNKKESYLFLEKLYQNEESSIAILALLIFQFRVLLALKEDANEIISSTHPYVLSKTKLFAKNFTKDEVQLIYRKLLEADIALKTGSAPQKVVMAKLLGYIVK